MPYFVKLNHNLGIRTPSEIVGDLLFVNKIHYLDYSYVQLSDGTNIVVPVKREGYIFYIEDPCSCDMMGNPAIIRVSTKLQTVYGIDGGVIKCDIATDVVDAEECESVKEFATYFPKSKKHREIRFTNIMQRNRFH